MATDGLSFRLQVRCSKVEDAALYRDLMQYPDGSARTGRVRCLLRLGLLAAQSAPMPALPAGSVPAMSQPPAQGQAEHLMANGLDIRQFAFTCEKTN
jgi:hypothetical protein